MNKIDLNVALPEPADDHLDLVIARPPLDIGGFDLKQHWHRKFHNDSRNHWLRRQVTQLFNDENDEWAADWKTEPRSAAR